jgi:hypothetical protein
MLKAAYVLSAALAQMDLYALVEVAFAAPCVGMGLPVAMFSSGMNCASDFSTMAQST